MPTYYELSPKLRETIDKFIEINGLEAFEDVITKGDITKKQVLEIIKEYLPDRFNLAELAIKSIFPEAFFKRDKHETK